MNNVLNHFLGLAVLMILVVSCTQTTSTEKENNTETTSSASNIHYASGFDIRDNVLLIKEPWPGANRPQVIELGEAPKRVIVTATSHLPFMEMLGVENALVGFPNTDYIYSPKLRKLVEQDKISDLGPGNSMNLEKIIELEPDLIIVFDMAGESSGIDKFEAAGINVLYNSDFLETSILGRAEWIKVFGAIFQQREKADQIFKAVEDTYMAYKSIASKSKEKPTVFSGIMYGDTWFLPGGKNWSAQLIEDAGGDYLWKENGQHGWLELGFESVFEKAHAADFWIGTATLNSLVDLSGQDERYSKFNAFQNSNVYNYSKRQSQGGGYDYFESAYARPDLVIADLVAILHPELMTNHEFHYYERLR